MAGLTSSQSMWTIAQHMITLACGVLIGLTIGTAQVALLYQGVGTSTCQPQEFRHSGKGIARPDTGFVVDQSTGAVRCGDSWRDASRLGCRFDILASRWYYEECSNAAIMESMLQEVQFDFFEDKEHTKQIPSEVALSGKFDGRIFPYPDFHIMHCLYLWRRLHAAILEHRHIDDDIYDFGHTLHCTRMIMKWPEWLKSGKNSTTSIGAGIPFCKDRGF